MTTYLVTGCGRGVGLALTTALLARGDRVFGSVRQAPSPISHPQFTSLTFDVRDQAAIEAAARSVQEPINVLINNAGIRGPRTKSTLETDFPGFAETLDVNVLGPLRVVQAFLPHLRRAKASKVMTLSSQLGGMTYPGSDRIAYRSSKAALNKVMQGVAEDLAKEGIAVVIVHPGWVRTDMGGPHGELTAEESAKGLVAICDTLTVETTGRFLNWNGSSRPW